VPDPSRNLHEVQVLLAIRRAFARVAHLVPRLSTSLAGSEAGKECRAPRRICTKCKSCWRFGRFSRGSRTWSRGYRPALRAARWGKGDGPLAKFARSASSVGNSDGSREGHAPGAAATTRGAGGEAGKGAGPLAEFARSFPLWANSVRVARPIPGAAGGSGDGRREDRRLRVSAETRKRRNGEPRSGGGSTPSASSPAHATPSVELDLLLVRAQVPKTHTQLRRGVPRL